MRWGWVTSMPTELSTSRWRVHQDGHYIVTIYNGGGESACDVDRLCADAAGDDHRPARAGVGPLDVAVGDFTGAGVSDLAISSTGTGRAGSSKVAVYTFKLDDSTPINSPVTPCSWVSRSSRLVSAERTDSAWRRRTPTATALHSSLSGRPRRCRAESRS